MAYLTFKQNRNLRRILPFGLVWGVMTMVYLLLERGLLGQSEHYPATGNPYDFISALPMTLISAIIMGWIIGAVEILVLKNKFQKFAFTTRILIKFFIYLFSTILFMSVLNAAGNSILMGEPPWSLDVRNAMIKFCSNFIFWAIAGYIGMMILVSVFLAEIASHMGQGVLLNLVAGRYHQPTEEERVFMFLDMNASTMIAEKLGYMNYFRLLKEYFADMSDAILKTNGEVYQYVGDEIVVSWKTSEGLNNANCLHCFYQIKDIMRSQKEKYLEKYRFFPTFKAGMHMGTVATGKIGKLKQDILYTGDVLNTTARIQGYCSVLNTELLISKNLKDALKEMDAFKFHDIGFQSLRGRDKEMQIFICEKSGAQ